MRSLVLAGGGAKLGWGAGVLQILFDEAELRFDHIDATSGAVMNLGMLLSGKTATEITQAWQDASPRDFVSFHRPWKYLTPWRLPSLFTHDGIQKRVVPKWGIDPDRIRACEAIYGHPVEGTFTVLDYSAKRVVTIPASRMDMDYFRAVYSVPGVVPPVEKDGTRYLDAMLLTEANLSAAIRRGADEIWVIWTVDDTAEWKGGLYNHLGHVFEITANGNYKRELDAIERINREVALGRADPGRRHVTVHEIRPPEQIPVGYLAWLRKRTMHEVVELGKRHAREYLERRGFLEPENGSGPGPGVRFKETMSGRFTAGETDFEAGDRNGRELEFTLTITIDDVARFVRDPDHAARAVGEVKSPELGGVCPVENGVFKLFRVDERGNRRMEYRLPFRDSDGRRRVLDGFKIVRDDPGLDLWSDTTTLMTRILDAESGRPIGSGLLRIAPHQFMRQLMTFEAVGTTSAAESVETLGRFGRFFLGGLWDTYGAGRFGR